MGGVSIRTAPVGRKLYVRIAADRVRIGLRQAFRWIEEKARQITAIPFRNDLIHAVVSAEKPPVEGPRRRVGDRVMFYQADGSLRRLKICGVRSGGFSNVYMVVDLDEMRPYCLKENRALPGDDFTKEQTLAIEASIALRLDPHPNVVTAFAAAHCYGRLHVLTEYVPGRSLDEDLKAGVLPTKTALRYAVHLCRAVRHAQLTLPGFIHGDIKPGNCIVTPEGTVKLSDFGLASADGIGRCGPPPPSGRSQPPRIGVGWGGTAAYMAPEMHDRNAPDRTAADVYAFGVTLFEMLTGSRPFGGASVRELVQMHIESAPPLEKLAEKNVPQPIIELIRSCLAKSPALRPASFEKIEQELLRVIADECEAHVTAPRNQFPEHRLLAKRALSLAELGCVEQSVICIDTAIRRSGPSSDLLAVKAIALALGGRSSDASLASTAALEEDPDRFIVLLAHARVLIASDELLSAESFLQRALLLEPENCIVLNLLGKLTSRRAGFAEATVYFNRSLALDRPQAEAWEGLARASQAMGLPGRARRCAARSIKIDPRRADAHGVLGEDWLRRNQLSKAIDSFKTAMKYGPASRKFARQFVRACVQLWRSSGRGEVDPQVLRLLMRGTVLQRCRPVRGAAADAYALRFMHTLGEHGHDPHLLFFLDAVLIRLAGILTPNVLDRLSEEVSSLYDRSAARAVPSYLLHAFGRVFYEFGDYGRCQAAFRRLLAQAGPDENSFYFLGACSEIAGDLESALNFYKKAMRIDDREDTRTGIGRVSARLKRRTAASAA